MKKLILLLAVVFVVGLTVSKVNAKVNDTKKAGVTVVDNNVKTSPEGEKEKDKTKAKAKTEKSKKCSGECDKGCSGEKTSSKEGKSCEGKCEGKKTADTSTGNNK